MSAPTTTAPAVRQAARFAAPVAPAAPSMDGWRLVSIGQQGFSVGITVTPPPPGEGVVSAEMNAVHTRFAEALASVRGAVLDGEQGRPRRQARERLDAHRAELAVTARRCGELSGRRDLLVRQGKNAELDGVEADLLAVGQLRDRLAGRTATLEAQEAEAKKLLRRVLSAALMGEIFRLRREASARLTDANMAVLPAVVPVLVELRAASVLFSHADNLKAEDFARLD